jgi:hypothetical protein
VGRESSETDQSPRASIGVNGEAPANQTEENKRRWTHCNQTLCREAPSTGQFDQLSLGRKVHPEHFYSAAEPSFFPAWEICRRWNDGHPVDFAWKVLSYSARRRLYTRKLMVGMPRRTRVEGSGTAVIFAPKLAGKLQQERAPR